MRKIYTLALLMLSFISFECKSQNATFNVTFNGSTTPDVEAAINYAAKQWSNYLVSPVPIKVLVNWYPLVPGLLGITFPNGEINFPSAPVADSWYASCLANSLEGTELNSGEMDIEIYLNSSQTWYTDTTGTVTGGAYDLVTITMHEMGHGLGILGLSKKSGAEGSLGMLTAADFFPLGPTTFTWPDLDSMPSIFDRHLESNTMELLDTFPNPSNALGTQMTNGNMYFNGPFTLAANAGNRARIYAPSTFALGSSMTHLNEATYPVGNINELMTPNGHPGNANHNPGPVTLGILRDIGWNLTGAGIEEGNKVVYAPSLFIYPNPTEENVYVALEGSKEIPASVNISNLLGENVISLNEISSNGLIDVHTLPAGIYFVNFLCGENEYSGKFVKR